ncbi:MAG TPA: T9SS type A sorting domain-containing protein [candidate division Zixibacteria bacterium]|nr:T9SS type A sorting domain-containing protein [candidate division Zixibacteria bacterium]
MKKVFMLTIMLTITFMATDAILAGNSLGLLVSNASSLDIEEQAAYDFAASHGFTVTIIDPSIISGDPSILNSVDGFWAANNAAPAGFNQPVVSDALRAQLEGGKRMLVSWYGVYLVSYMGIASVNMSSSWYPSVSDHMYWVDKRIDHPVFENVPEWIPPTMPDNASQLLAYVTPGYAPGGPYISGGPATILQYAQLWVTYGWCGQSFNPELQTEYGITGTCERAVRVDSFAEYPVGSGSVFAKFWSLTGGNNFHYGALGYQLLENALNYVCSGFGPRNILLYTTRNMYGNGILRTDFDDDLPAILATEGFTVTAEDRGSMPELTSEILSEYSQLWFVSGTNSQVLSASEVQAILDFHAHGKGLMVISDGCVYQAPANQISPSLGVTFGGSCCDCDHCGGSVGCAISTAAFVPHEIWDGVGSIQANLNEGDFTASPPAQVIAAHNGINMVAVRDDTGGRVAWDATIYRFYDHDSYTEVNILQADNPQYVKNLAIWLEGNTGDGFASIQGIVQDFDVGLPGITLDIYATDGNLWQSVVTDDTGHYHIDSIPNGDYTISVVTPLGYQADQETKEFTINHVPVTVDFTLTQLNITPVPRSRAYWAHQLYRALRNNPQDYTIDDFANFTALIDKHFNQNQLNPIDFYNVSEPATQTDSMNVLIDLLHIRPAGDDWQPTPQRLAKAQLMSLMLNVVSGKVHQAQIISEDGRTVSQAITYCDMLVNDEIDPPDDGGPGCGSEWCGYLRASYILNFCNLGLLVPEGMIPEDVVNIAYRIHNEVSLPQEYELAQNFPNPFNPETEISYILPEASHVKLEIFNIMGQKVISLVDEFQDSGSYTVRWNSIGRDGRTVSSGIYFYRLTTGQLMQTRKMVLMK